MAHPWHAVQIVAVATSLIALERIITGLSALPGRTRVRKKMKALPPAKEAHS